MALKPRSRQRRAAHLVEMAAVVSVFLLFLFGIVEYCRFVFVRQVVVNAAREGARYAVVNTLDTTIVTDTQNYVKTRMAGLDKSVTGYSCQVYMADSNGNNVGYAGNAKFGEYVAVQIDCNYNAILPNFFFLGNTIKISSKSLMYSEAN